VLERVELRPVLEQRLGDVGGGTAEQERVAISSGASCLRRADRTTSAADVLDDHRAQKRFYSVRPRATDGVERPAWREWNDEAYGPRRIALRARDPRGRRQRASSRCQIQKWTARKSHGRFRTEMLRQRTRAQRQRLARSQRRRGRRHHRGDFAQVILTSSRKRCVASKRAPAKRLGGRGEGLSLLHDV